MSFAIAKIIQLKEIWRFLLMVQLGNQKYRRMVLKLYFHILACKKKLAKSLVQQRSHMS
jgi:hypothetical protein